MSDAHSEQSFIRTPKQLIGVVAGFFLVIVIGIILLVSFVTNDKLAGAGTNSLGPEAVAQRLRPVAEEGFTLRDANAPKVLQAGNAVYAAVCAACHTSGAAGAPKVGVAGDWNARLAQGYDTLVKHAIEGIRAMPAKGGNPDLENVEVERAVVYMANQSGAKFKEPAVPAPAAAPVAAAASVVPAAANAASASPAAAMPAAAPPPAPAAAPVAAPAVASAEVGKALYNSACIACHGAGIAGAPKLADKAAWAPRIKQGNAVLYEHALKGFQGKAGVMPPKGGSSAPDADVKAAVDFMVASSR
ncbi:MULTISPECIES: cytochrome c5 family protein [unclassified Massilia]|uniref:c-type cytochrome n=1 Tax=unclassified Massilia TaxID=2609279 RepID=UPI001784431E|nr:MULTISPECIES: c-type cytochrome [unclassified Massilia]MBD8531367.1 cytochrome c5 family protein [Massilia sp. CFBP 13647]MBD8674379.1 cytochrome c5 family protein [Massilia sp. CFBP 13721]